MPRDWDYIDAAQALLRRVRGCELQVEVLAGLMRAVWGSVEIRWMVGRSV